MSALRLSAQEQPTCAFGPELLHLVLATAHQESKTAQHGLPQQNVTRTNAQPTKKYAYGTLPEKHAVAHQMQLNALDKPTMSALELSAQEQTTCAFGQELLHLVLAIAHRTITNANN